MPKRDAAGEQGFRLGPGESGIANQAEFDGIKTAQPKTLATPEIMSTRKIAAPKGARRPPGSPRPGMFSSAVDQIGNPFAPQPNGTGPVNGMNGALPFPAFGQQPSQTQQLNTPNSSIFGANSNSSAFSFTNPTQGGSGGLFNSSNQSHSDQQQATQAQNGGNKTFGFTFGAASSSDNSTKPNNTFNFGGSTANNPFAGLSQPSTSSSGGLFSPAPKPASSSFPPSQGSGLSGFANGSANNSQGNAFGGFGNVGQSNSFGGSSNSASQQANGIFQQQNNNPFQQTQQQGTNLFQQPQQTKNLFQQQPQQSGSLFNQSENKGQQQSTEETKATNPSDSMQVSPPTSPARNGNQQSIFDVMTNGNQSQQTPKANIFGNLQQNKEQQSQSSTFSSNQEQTSTHSQPSKPLFTGFGKSDSQQHPEADAAATSTTSQQSLPAFAGFGQDKLQATTTPETTGSEQLSKNHSGQTNMSTPQFNSPSFGSSAVADPFSNNGSAPGSTAGPAVPKFEAPSFKPGPFSNPFNKSTEGTLPSSAAPKFEAPLFKSGPFSNPFELSPASTSPSSAAPKFEAPSFKSGPFSNPFEKSIDNTPKSSSPNVEPTPPESGPSHLFEKPSANAEKHSSARNPASPFFGQEASFNPFGAKEVSTSATPEKPSASPGPSFFPQFKANPEQPTSLTSPSAFSKGPAFSNIGPSKASDTSTSTPKFHFGSDKPVDSFGASAPTAKPFEGFQMKDKTNDTTENSLFIPSGQSPLPTSKQSDKAVTKVAAPGVESLTKEQKQVYEAQLALRSLNHGFMRAMSALDPLQDQSDMMRAYLSAADKIKKGFLAGSKRKQQDEPPDTPKRTRTEDESPSIANSQPRSTTANLFQSIVGADTTPSKTASPLFFSQPKTPASGPESRSLFAGITADAPATEPANSISGGSLFDRIDKPATEVKKPAFSFFPPTPTSSDGATPGDHTWKNDSPIKFGASQPQPSQPQFLFAGSASGSANTSRATSPGAGDGGTTSEAESTTSNPGDDAEKPLDQVDLTAVDENSEIIYETDKARGQTRDLESKAWVVRGQGPLRILKDKENGLISVLLRTVPSGRVVFNSRLVKGLSYKVAGKNAVMMPVVGSDGKPETWHLRFKTQGLADEFAEACEKWKDSASS